jgi:predicted transposase YbfD/YdcC
MTVDPEDPALTAIPGIHQIFCIERTRKNLKKGTSQSETIYAVSNATREQLSPEQAAQVNKKHWRIETYHRQKDVAFQEDADRTHTNHSPHNLAILRTLAINVINLSTSPNGTERHRRQVVRLQPWRAHKIMGLQEVAA